MKNIALSYVSNMLNYEKCLKKDIKEVNYNLIKRLYNDKST